MYNRIQKVSMLKPVNHVWFGKWLACQAEKGSGVKVSETMVSLSMSI